MVIIGKWAVVGPIMRLIDPISVSDDHGKEITDQIAMMDLGDPISDHKPLIHSIIDQYYIVNHWHD